MNLRPVAPALLVIPLLAILCSGCSASKNTIFSRTYHSLTTRYNVLFNGQERFKKGVRTLEDSHRDDYSALLPIFPFDDKIAEQTIAGDMDYSIQKANKAIMLHSIKVKPDFDRMRMTPEQRKFYNKKEFNVFIDNCYLLMGKSYFMKHDYYTAIETFQRMIDLFPSERLLFEAELWRIRALAREGRKEEAGVAVKDLLDNKMLPSSRKYSRELNATLADLAIRGGKYDQAILSLKEAAENAGGFRKEKQRYWYILGQLHLLRNQQQEALVFFNKIKRRSSSYEMSFNARLNRALSFISGAGGNKADIQADLFKMLRDTKNEDYQDRIYYTLAEIERMDGQTDKALGFYKQSVLSSRSNPSQKAVSALAAARLFDARRAYIQAVAYYDTAFIYLDPSQTEYALFAKRAQVLSSLAVHLGVVMRQDSLQKVAALSEGIRSALIAKIIADGKSQEKEQQADETQRLSRYYAQRNRLTMSQESSAIGAWYFYNAATLSRGLEDFEMKWGRRVLEDDWRRKNKSQSDASVSLAQKASPAEPDSSLWDTGSAAYYLRPLPLSDSLMRLSNQAIQNSLYEAGYLYLNELDEPALAISCYRDLIQRYPQGDFVPASYYYLSTLYTKIGSTDSATLWKARLLSEAPRSRYALMLQDPDYLLNEQQQRAQVDILYQNVYEAYSNNNHSAVSAGVQEALAKYPQSDLLPKFVYLQIVSQAVATHNQTELRRQLADFIVEYDKNEVVLAARALMETLDAQNPEVRRVVQEERARVLFQAELNQPHAVAVWARSSENINQLSFDILNFNVDFYPQASLSVSQSPMQQGRILMWVQWFDTYQKAMEYYRRLSSNTKALSSMTSPFEIFVISQANQLMLKNGQSPDDYLPFFRDTYLK